MRAVLILSREQVEELLDLGALVDAVGHAMADLSAGSASMPPRVAAEAERSGILAAMPAYLPSARALTTKLVTLYAANAGTALPTHQAVILAFDPATGEPLALLDGTSITAARTAAGSALSVRLLAREDAQVLAIVGTGVQAESHGRAVPRERSFREIRIAGRDRAAAARLAELLAASTATPVHAMPSIEEAIEGADVVCACTHAEEPVVRRAWLRPGAHVASVGLNPQGREVDAETVRDAVVVVESRASALAPFPAGANDLTWPVRDGIVGPDRVHAEIGEVLTGVRPGRTDPDEITLYKSVGVAVQDAAAAALVLAAARERGLGTNIALA